MLPILGILLLCFLLLDVLRTTMGIGGGWLTRRLSHGLSRVILALHRRRPSRPLMIWGGIAVLLTVFLTWVTILWTGWTLIFLGSDQAVLEAATGQPAGLASRIYFTGFTIFTLGTGDYHAGSDGWEVLMAFASLSGLFLITLSITYLLPVVQAATQKRQLAVVISSLGLTGPSILINALRDGDCSGLDGHLTTLVPSLAQLEQQHLTYPILHYLHGRRRAEALGLSLAALDEALTLLELGVENRCGVTPAAYRPMRQVITQFLYTLQNAFIDPADEPPPPPSLAELRKLDLATVPDDTFTARLHELELRRRLLAALVAQEGWSWTFSESGGGPDAPTRALHQGWTRTPAS